MICLESYFRFTIEIKKSDILIIIIILLLFCVAPVIETGYH